MESLCPVNGVPCRILRLLGRGKGACSYPAPREGIPVVSWKGLPEMKPAMGREKDLRDAERIRACPDSGAKQEAEGQA